MKKKPLITREYPCEVKKILRKMRITLLFVLLFGFYAEASSQKVTLKVKDMNLYTVLLQLKNQTGVRMLYDADYTKQIKCNDVTFQEEDIAVVLEKLLKDTPLTFNVVNGVYVINKAPEKEEEKQVKLSGIVKDKQGDPLPGVTIIIKGTTTGVSTDALGKFLLNVKSQEKIVLVFTFIGMKRLEVTATPDKPMNIVMEEDAQEMEEVVVTGYQVIDKRKSTSAITTVNMDDIMVPGATTLDQMLEGRVSDMILMNNSGEVGVVPQIRIRGTSTLIGNREPLWVVDGIIVQDPVPISADELNDPDYINRIGNAIAGLNPQDIERLDILKDAAATALYGAKAANGVIVITTKKGSIGAPVISYNMSGTFRQRPRYTDRKINLMDSKERIQFSRELSEQHYVYPSNINYVGYEGLLNDLHLGNIDEKTFAEQVAYLETVNTDWFDLLTEDTFSHQHTVSISGGSEKTRYYSSIGFSRANDVIKGNYNQRYTATLKMETSLNKWFTASFQLLGNVSERKYNQSSINPINYAYNTSRTIPAYDEEGEYYYYNKLDGNTSLSTKKYNIMNELDNSYSNQNTSGITLNTNLRFKFSPWLNASAIVSYSNSNADIEGWWGEKSFYAAKNRASEYGTLPKTGEAGTTTLPFGGELSRSTTRTDSYTIRLQMNLNKYFGPEEQHNINASAGFELSSSRYNGFKSVHRGYYKDRGKRFVAEISMTDYPHYAAWLAKNVPTSTDNLTNMVSEYATVSYSYRNYFTVNANARMDGSNKFGDQSNNTFLPIWSISGSYNISEHEALQTEWIDYMRLKASFGYQGNMLDDQSPVMIIEKLPLDPYYNENVSQVERNPNPNLRWEKTSSFNTGLTLSLFKRRIQLETQYYYKRTKDAFMTKDVASMNGVDSYVINGGDVENKGYSVDFTAIPVTNKNWRWLLSISFSRNYNMIKNDPSAQTYTYNQFLKGTAVVKGKAINTFYSYKFVGLSPIDGGPLFDDMQNNRHLLSGLDRYDTFTRVLTPSGNREPYISGGLSTNIKYRNLRLSGMFSYSLGAKTRLFRLFDSTIKPEFNVSRDFLNRWQHPGDEKYTNIPALISSNHASYRKYSSHYSKTYSDIQTFASSAWTMYDYADIRVVSANYLKCSSLNLTYEFSKQLLSRADISRLAITLSGTNLFTWCSIKLRGQTPTQG
ncbi:SusC/RagA family TonB-linked outer membrane protein [uncultured Butyricimonas sp.]|uniref:SusC/RagA family TonB-linked outer membrane protein n=1 Tax=uncultured Butyricimonas sp. TaxID=1268785 RepID=UPI0026DCE66C|nr:SusC/RagA family TonB-linked outer membrane protein [uncultured Butyricimonas sp.]